jgi:tetratricopeptide (TPR) repeat protein
VVHDESFISLIREGIQVRSSYGVYRSLYKYMEYLTAEKAAGRPARVLDGHFVSGVKFGLGCFNLMLSILPTSLLKLVEFIGFSSDRNFGLSLLESQGGWESFHKDPEQPLPEQTDARSGLRRQFCDMVIITYHTVISTFMPVPDADPIFSERLIQYNLTKYPSGVFFLYFSGRSLAARGLLDEAILQFKKTIEIQREWRQLQHICYWELGLLFLMKGEWESGHECFEILSQESNWSKATYTYFSAAALYDQAQDMTDEKDKEKAMKKVEALMKSIPKLTKKIAGKSIPVEVSIGFPYVYIYVA